MMNQRSATSPSGGPAFASNAATPSTSVTDQERSCTPGTLGRVGRRAFRKAHATLPNLTLSCQQE
jgi:hypothetical protein